jgi:hypothetical protein
MRLSQDENAEKSMLKIKIYRSRLENYMILDCYRRSAEGEDRELKRRYVWAKDGRKSPEKTSRPGSNEIILSEFFRLW